MFALRKGIFIMNAFFFALLAGIVWGTSTILEKIGLTGTGTDPLAGVWARSLGVFLGGACMMFVVPQMATKITAMGWRSTLWLASAGFMASVLGQIFFYRALKLGDVGRVAPVAGAWPLVAFAWSLLLLNEAPTVKKILGALLVVCGVILLK